jgi:hypothetical protein
MIPATVPDSRFTRLLALQESLEKHASPARAMGGEAMARFADEHFDALQALLAAAGKEVESLLPATLSSPDGPEALRIRMLLATSGALYGSEAGHGLGAFCRRGSLQPLSLPIVRSLPNQLGDWPDHPEAMACLGGALALVAAAEPDKVPLCLMGAGSMTGQAENLAAALLFMHTLRITPALLEVPGTGEPLARAIALLTRREDRAKQSFLKLADPARPLWHARCPLFPWQASPQTFLECLASAGADPGSMDDPEAARTWARPVSPEPAALSFAAASLVLPAVICPGTGEGYGRYPVLREIQAHPELLEIPLRPGDPGGETVAHALARAHPESLDPAAPAARETGHGIPPVLAALLRLSGYPASWPKPLPLPVLALREPGPGGRTAAEICYKAGWTEALGGPKTPETPPWLGVANPEILGDLIPEGPVLMWTTGFQHLFYGRITPVLESFLAPETQSAWEEWTRRTGAGTPEGPATPWEGLWWTFTRFMEKKARSVGMLETVLPLLADPAIATRPVRPPVPPKKHENHRNAPYVPSPKGRPKPFADAFSIFLVQCWAASARAPKTLEDNAQILLEWFEQTKGILAQAGFERSPVLRLPSVAPALSIPLRAADGGTWTMGEALEDILVRGRALQAMKTDPDQVFDPEPIL